MYQDVNQGIEDKHFEHKLSHKEQTWLEPAVFR